MTGKLPREQVERHIATLRQRTQITTVQAARLAEVACLLDARNQFDVKKAIDAAEFADGQEFREFCRQFNATVESLNVPLKLEIEKQAATSRHFKGWFTGASRI